MFVKKLAFVHADWCGPCRFMLERTIKPLAAEFPDAVETVDASSVGSLAAYSPGKRLPLTIIYEDGEEWWRMEGVVDRELLKSLLTS